MISTVIAIWPLTIAPCCNHILVLAVMNTTTNMPTPMSILTATITCMSMVMSTTTATLLWMSFLR